MKEAKLNSFALHPQIKAKHANKESEKLTNHDTTPTPTSTPTSTSTGTGGFEPATESTPVTGSN